MRTAVFLTGLIISVLLSLACLAAILIYFAPISSTLLVFSLFYISLFISSAGIFALIGLIARRISHRKTPLNRANQQLWDSFRQGMLLAIILVVALILQSQRALCWWNSLIIISAAGLIEFWAIKK